MVRALAGTGTAGRMTYWAKCGQIRARSGRRREFPRSRDEGDGEGPRNGAATSGGAVSAGDGLGDGAQPRGPGVHLAQLGGACGEGRTGVASGSRGLPEEFLQSPRIGAGCAGWARSGVLSETDGASGMAPHGWREAETLGGPSLPEREAAPAHFSQALRARGGRGAGQSGPRNGFPAARGQTTTARGCSRGGDGDRVVGFLQPVGRASAGATVPVFRKS